MLHLSITVNKSRNISGLDVDLDATLGLRPLSARSMVLSALLGTHPPRLPIGALVTLGERFGLAAGAVRTAVSRMTAGGDLVAVEGGYQLAGRFLERQRQQDIGRRVTDTRWDGQWWMVSALTARRSAAERRQFRSAMEGAKLAELRPDTWMRPTNLPLEVDLHDIIITRGPLTMTASRDLCYRLWNLSELSSRADALRQALDAMAATMNPDSIAFGFTVLAACLRFLRIEPQLPTQLLSARSAVELRIRYADVEADLQRQLRELFRSTRHDGRAISTAAL